MKNKPNPFLVGHSRLEQWAMGALCLFVVAFFFLPLYVGWGPWRVMVYFYLGLAFILSFPLRLWIETFSQLHLYQEGIEIRQLFKPVQFLFWDEITQIRGSVWRSDLVIANRRGDVSCRVNSSYSNAHNLLHLLLYARPDLFQINQSLTFTISPIPVVLLAADLAMLAFFGAHRVFSGSSGTLLLAMFAASLVILVAALLLIPYSLTILGSHVLFRYPFRKALLSAADVANIDKITRIDLVYEWGEVTVRQKNGRVTLLMFYNLGVSLLYAFLTCWQQIATRPRLPSGDALEPEPVGGHRRFRGAPFFLPER